MGKLNAVKLVLGIFLLIMLVGSNFALGNLAAPTQSQISNTYDNSYRQSNYAEEPKSFGASWDLTAPRLATSASSVDLVIGVSGTHQNSYAGLSGIVSKYSGKIAETLSMDNAQAIVVNVPSAVVSTFVGEARASGLTRYIEPRGQCQVDLTPNDPGWSNQWGPEIIDAPTAWDTTTGNSSVLVAVIDTGIDYTHPDLAGNYVPLGYDWVNMDNDPIDDFGHGTHCAGIIAATINNSVGIAGMAQVRIMAEKGLNANGSGWYDDLANCIIHAVDQGANILSNSWGSNESSNVIHDAIIYAQNHNVLVLASAGNSGLNELRYPGAFEEVVAVTATNSSDQIAWFSTYGDWVDVAAPGVSIYSTMPTYNVTMNNQYYNLPLNYANMSGTSMACPHAAGVAALIWGMHPTLNATIVRYQLESTVDDLGTVGFDIYYGYGRINAAAAVERPIHEVGVYWPELDSKFAKLGSVTTFSVTPSNYGLVNETNVQLLLLINGTVVNSTSIPLLLTGARTPILLSWTPESYGTYNVTFYIPPIEDETLTGNNARSQWLMVGAPPSDENWTLIATDPDEGAGLNLKAAYSQMRSNTVYFKVDFYRAWTVAKLSMDTGIFLDTDRNPRTGLPDGYYAKQNCYVGSDMMIVVGGEGPELWRWNSNTGFFDTITPGISYLDLPQNSSWFVVGVNVADLHTDGVFDCFFCDAWSFWDWMPDLGYVPFIQDTFQHELAATLYTPLMLEPNEGTSITANVFNFGLNAETNVTLQILIDGQVVRTTTFSNLPNGTARNMTYTWLTPPLEQHCNVTAYVLPVAGETVTANNVENRMVHVSQKIAIISDDEELFGLAVILDSMNINYDQYNYNYYEENNLYTENLTLLQNYPTVIFFKNDRIISQTEHDVLNAYLASGGNLVATGFDSLGDPDDPLLADVVRSSTVGDDTNQPDLIVVNSTHPIMNGPYGSFPVGFTITDLYEDNDLAEADTARNAQTIAELGDGYDKIIATEGLPGTVVYWNGVDDWPNQENCTQMIKNLLVWLVDTQPPTTTNDYDGLWHTADFTINLSATDYFAVNQTYYKLNNGATKTVSVDGQPNITSENANNTLEYWSTDSVGNEEPHHMLINIKLDKTGPVATILVNGAQQNYVRNKVVALNLSAQDSVSNVEAMCFSNDYFVWSNWEAYAPTKSWTLTDGDGTKSVYARFRNYAGLVSDHRIFVILDTTAPTADMSKSRVVASEHIIMFDGSGSSDTSGISSYLWNFGDGAQGTGAAIGHAYAPGTYQATLTVTDMAGNTATASMTITFSVITPAASNPWSPTPIPTENPSPTPTTSPTSSPTPSGEPTTSPPPTDNTSITYVIVGVIGFAGVLIVLIVLVKIKKP